MRWLYLVLLAATGAEWKRPLIADTLGLFEVKNGWQVNLSYYSHVLISIEHI
jgi:hypothetical protein